MVKQKMPFGHITLKTTGLILQIASNGCYGNLKMLLFAVIYFLYLTYLPLWCQIKLHLFSFELFVLFSFF